MLNSASGYSSEGLAVATFALGASQAGWRHRAFISALFAMSAIFAAASVWYETLRIRWPVAASSAGSLAVDVRVWFGLVVILAVTMLILSVLDAARMRSQTASQRRTTTPATPIPSPRPVSQRKIITDAYRRTFAKELGGMGQPYTVKIIANGANRDYAQTFVEMFKAAEWTIVKDANSNDIWSPDFTMSHGITVRAKVWLNGSPQILMACTKIGIIANHEIIPTSDPRSRDVNQFEVGDPPDQLLFRET
jgi:hypothetical protein